MDRGCIVPEHQSFRNMCLWLRQHQEVAFFELREVHVIAVPWHQTWHIGICFSMSGDVIVGTLLLAWVGDQVWPVILTDHAFSETACGRCLPCQTEVCTRADAGNVNRVGVILAASSEKTIGLRRVTNREEQWTPTRSRTYTGTLQ